MFVVGVSFLPSHCFSFLFVLLSSVYRFLCVVFGCEFLILSLHSLQHYSSDCYRCKNICAAESANEFVESKRKVKKPSECNMRAKKCSLMCTFSVFFSFILVDVFSWFHISTKKIERSKKKMESIEIIRTIYVRYRTKCQRIVLISSITNPLHWQKLQQFFFSSYGSSFFQFPYSEYQFITGNIGKRTSFRPYHRQESIYPKRIVRSKVSAAC